MKDSFILYTEQKEIFDNLSDEEAGQLIKAIFDYAETGKISNLNKTLKLLFIPIRQDLDRNSDKWEKTKEKRSLAGKKGMQKRWESKSEIVTNDNNVIADITKYNKNNNDTNIITNDNNVIDDITKITNITVNDNVNVNVNDNVNVNKKENIKEKEPKIHFAEFVTMTNAEYNKLVSTYSKEFADQCIEVLDNYKGSIGKKYKSDYRAVLSWVIDEVKKRKQQKTTKKSNFTSRTYENLNDLYFNTGQGRGKNE